MSTEVVSTEFCMMDLRELYESESNPRRHFNQEFADGLAASVKEHGVLTPLLVRRKSNAADALYEIIAGAQRYRAAKQAECELVPVRIKEMTDEQALEFQLIENLQRRDVHPLDEALGFVKLHEMGKTTEEIVGRLSKSASYVYQRMKLAALIPEAQRLFLEDGMTAGHAVQIARLNPTHQKEVLKWMARTDVSVRDLGEQIANQYHLTLKGAAFPTDDPELFPMAGSCKECPKRSGANPLLFPDVKAKDTCSDPLCYKAKELAFVKLQTEKNPEAMALVLRPSYQERPKKEVVWTQTAGRKCEDTGIGIVTQIEDRYEAERAKVKLGQELEVCINPNCKVHHPKTVVDDASYQARTGRSRGEEKAAKLETKRQMAILQAVLLRPAEEPSATELKQQLAWALENLSADAARLVCKAMGWEVKPDKYKQRNYHGAVEGKLRDAKNPAATLYLVAVISDMWGNGAASNDAKNARTLEAAASRRGVNVAAISKQVKEAAEKKPKAKPEEKPKAEKPKKAVKAKAKKAPKKKAA